MPEGDAPKLIIDTDWKSQAQAEKQRLSDAAKPKSPAPPPAGSPAEAAQDQEIGFQDLVRMLVTQTLSYLGAFPDPKTGKAVVSIEMARVFIDLLGVLEQKTKGNLTQEESTLLSRTVSELRTEWVEISKVIAQAVAEGKIQPGAAGLDPNAVAPASSMPGGPPPGDPSFKLKF